MDIGLRSLSFIMQCLHWAISALFVFTMLLSSNIQVLLFVAFCGSVLFLMIHHFQGCVLSAYETPNADVFPGTSRAMGSVVMDARQLNTVQIETIIVGVALVLTLLKTVFIFGLQEFRGGRYVCSIRQP